MTKYILSIFFSVFFAFSGFCQISWEPSFNIATSSSGNNHPRITTDASGNPLVLWFKPNRVMFSRWNGTAFETPRTINPAAWSIAGANWMGPDIASHGDTIYVVFKQAPEDVGHSWCIHSYDGGETFSDPVQIDFDTDSISRFPTVTVDGTGNPVVAFMKFNSTFGDARWVVSRSDDFGKTFSPDVLASGWSSEASVVCDCCPGSVVSSGDNVVMLYRDNNSNMRDTWAGLSSDGGMSFSSGVNVDQQNWMISQCPASGPDGVIIGDTLYSTFMNGASGKTRVYTSHTSLTDFAPVESTLLTETFFGLSSQNFPRIASSGNAVSIVWKQQISGQDQLVLNFTSDITSGLAFVYDTVALHNISNADIAMWDNKIFVVWEDYNSGTVKFRSGSFEVKTGTSGYRPEELTVYPNPSNHQWYIKGENITPGLRMELFDARGQLVRVFPDYDVSGNFEIDNSLLGSGLYILRITGNDRHYVVRLIKP